MMLSVILPENMEVVFVDSLQKIFMKDKPLACPELYRISGLKGETVSFQMAYRYKGDYRSSQMLVQATKNPSILVKPISEIKDWIRLRRVEYAPSTLPCYGHYDEDYLTTEPGLFPDILTELEDRIQFIPNQWRSLWIDVAIPAEAEGGSYELVIQCLSLDNMVLKEKKLELEVIPAVLPKQKLIHTEWFYPDCLADYYQVKVFSAAFWKIVDNFLRTAVSRGINMILTPVFTPALDTLIGAERTTVQLVAIEKKEATYQFEFSNLRKWVKLCKEAGIEYFEISHLFSQWGARYAPKIIVKENGVNKKMFGWNTPAADGEYEEFLKAFLPCLIAELKALRIEQRTFFHISDEPTEENLETYGIARQMTKKLLTGFPVIDALSTLKIYQKGYVDYPVPTNEYIHEFLEAGMKHPWVYYCSGESEKVSNRFFAMPSYRNRILGIQMYLYGIEGFLHWGYNFYNSQYSIRRINPYCVTDADDAFPSGDAFLVYPGEQGEAVESIRLMVLYEAFCDVRAFTLLEELASREHVVKLIGRYADEPITFSTYPRNAQFIQQVREQVNQEIKELIAKHTLVETD